MKINLPHLAQHLQNRLAPIYLLAGDELTLKNDALKLIRKKASDAGFIDRLRINSGYDWEQLYSELNAISLMGDKRLIEIDFRDESPNKTATAILETYTANPSENNILLLDMAKLDYKILKTAWYCALEKNGVVVTIWPLQAHEVPQWINQRAAKYKLKLDPEALRLLNIYTEGNLNAAAQALEKIYLYLQSDENKVVTATVIELILENEARPTLYEFTDHFIAGNAEEAIKALQSLRDEATEPTIIIWNISRELRLLCQYAELLQQGMNFEKLFNQYKIFYRRQKCIRDSLQKFTAKDYFYLLAQLSDIDKIIKGVAPGNVWQSLEIFSLRCSN